MPQSHEEMLREFAKLANAMNTNNPCEDKAKQMANKTAAKVGAVLASVLVVLLLSTLGWVSLFTAHELGLISWSPTWWQAVRLIAPVLILLATLPLTLNVKVKQ